MASGEAAAAAGGGEAKESQDATFLSDLTTEKSEAPYMDPSARVTGGMRLGVTRKAFIWYDFIINRTMSCISFKFLNISAGETLVV